MQRLRFVWMLAIAISGMCASAEEIATVLLEPTADSARRDAAERVLTVDYPHYRALWESQRSNVDSFVIHRKAGLRIDGLCDDVPIRVTLQEGFIATATYAESAGECIAGRTVEAREFFWPIPSPDQLFQWVVELGSPASNSRLYGCLSTTFDAVTGIPTRIDAGCPTHIDDFITVEVRDIRTKK